jgi:acetyl-CoA acyltransferase
MTINRFCSSGLQAIALGGRRVAIGVERHRHRRRRRVDEHGADDRQQDQVSPEVMERFPHGVHADGHHRGERGEPVRDRPQGAGRVRLTRATRRPPPRRPRGASTEEIVPVRRALTRATSATTSTFKRDELVRADTTLEKRSPRSSPVLGQGQRHPGQQLAALRRRRGGAGDERRPAPRRWAPAARYFRRFVRWRASTPRSWASARRRRCASCSRRRALSVEGHRSLRDQRGLREPGRLRAAKLGIPEEKLNVNGGAIALGHPLGCTGAKLTATALHELKPRGGRYAIVSMCIGGGMGAAGLER